MKYTKSQNTYFAKPQAYAKDRIDLEVGDSKQTDFYPQIKMMRWDNEVNLSVRLLHDEVNPKVSKWFNTITWSGQKIDAKFYELSDGHEFEVILKEKPTSNVLKFSINTKELDFFYQPPLTQEEIDNGAFRPENVIGSYAVYHKTKKHNRFEPNDNITGAELARGLQEGWVKQENGKTYVLNQDIKSGKAFHIYRPYVVDNKGKKVWCDLYIDVEAGILTITLPQEFLDTAVYPVIVDPTFGYTSVGGTQSGSATNYRHSIRNISLSENGTGSSMSIYGKETVSTVGKLKAALYSGANGTSLVSETQEKTSGITTTAQWHTLNFIVPSDPSLSSGLYCPAFWHYFFAPFYDASTGSGQGQFTTYTNSWPSSISTDGDENFIYSVYVTYLSSSNNYTATVTDNIGVSETKTPQSTFLKSLTENFSLTDLISTVFSGGIDYVVEVIDTIWANLGAYGEVISENLSLTSQKLTTSQFYKEIADEVGLTDLVTRISSFVKSVTETLSLTETKTFIVGLGASVSETVSLTVQKLTQSSFLKSISETISLSDLTTKIGAFVRSVQETLSLSDVAGYFSGIILSVQDTLSLSSAKTAGANFLKELTEEISLSDLLQTGRDFAVTVTETIWATLRNFSATVTETLSTTDVKTPITSFLKSIDETLSLTDTFASIRTFLLSVSEEIGLTDVVSTFFGVIASVTEQLNLSDVTDSVKSQIVSVLEEMNLSIDSSQIFSIGVIISESLSLTESIIRKGWSWIIKHSSSWTERTKNTSTWSERTKNTTSWTEKDKNTASWTERDKNNSDWTFRDKS